MSEDTIVGAQMSIATVLKPPTGFEQNYQGRSPLSFPIALPGTRDPSAGERGYDPNLLAFVPVPLGSRLLLWLPQFIINEGVAPIPYRWRVLWRMRQTADQTQRATRGDGKLMAHLAGPSAGIPADGGVSGLPAQERIALPASINSVGYEQTEPVSLFTIADLNLHHEQVVVGGQSFDPTGPPILDAGGTLGVASQGIYPIAPGGVVNPDLIGPTFLPFQTDVFGDEFMLLVHREEGAAPMWDFGGQDFQLSELLGTANGARQPLPSTGVYAFHGSGAT